MPPLRNRKEDIPQLIDGFIERYCSEMKKPKSNMSTSAKKLLISFSWSGNIRQLQNTILRAVILSSGPTITESDLPPEICSNTSSPPDLSLKMPYFDELHPMSEAVSNFKRNLIQNAMDAASGNQAKAAKSLNIPRPNLSRMMKSLGMSKGKVQQPPLH